MNAFSITVEEAVSRIRATNDTVNAYVTTRLDEATADAQKRASEPARSPLHGVPYGLKDQWETLALPTTGGSYRHRHRRSTKNSSVFDAFDAAGAILVGKTNLSDFGLAPEATNHIVGPSRNPWDLRRTPGGSSGGAAAAVAAGMQGFDWGTDIGGSIRQPAAFCGVLGMRLSSATWPLHDAFPFIPRALAWMCGQGPFTRTTTQMRVVLDAAAPLRTGATRSFVPRGAMLMVPEDLGDWPTFVDDVRAHIEVALNGNVRTDHALPSGRRLRTIYSSVWASHLEQLLEADPTLSFGTGLAAVASSLLVGARRGDRRIHRHAAELLALMALGRVTVFMSSKRALENAHDVKERVEQWWDRGYVVVAPVACFPASLHGDGNKAHASVLCCTAAGNLSDATGLSIPFGRFGELPRGLQIMGPPGSESVLLDIADRLIASRDADASLAPRPWPDASRSPLR